MALNSGAIATGIAALSITGVTVKDITAIPDQVNASRDCPILFPHPNEWMAGGNGEPETGSASFGTASARSWIFARTYKYVYLHAPTGSARGIADHYSAMSAKADAIETAFTLLDLNYVDVKTISVSEFGVLQDPSGASFYGFTVTVTLREWING
jgi:hypothetical protein